MSRIRNPFRRRYVRVQLNCACPQEASPVADPKVKQQFVPRTFRIGDPPGRMGCADCGVHLRLTTV
jgi:hypothetical protein